MFMPSMFRSLGRVWPERWAKVGRRSIPVMMDLDSVPTGIFPFHWMMAGTRWPPSRTLPFLPLRGEAEPTLGPLSEVKMTMVFSSRLSSLSLVMILPVLQSISSTEAG